MHCAVAPGTVSSQQGVLLVALHRTAGGNTSCRCFAADAAAGASTNSISRLGERLLAGSRDYLTPSSVRQLIAAAGSSEINTPSQLLMSLQVHEDAIQDMQFSADGSYVITASLDKTAKLVDVISLEVREGVQCTGGVS